MSLAEHQISVVVQHPSVGYLQQVRPALIACQGRLSISIVSRILFRLGTVPAASKLRLADGRTSIPDDLFLLQDQLQSGIIQPERFRRLTDAIIDQDEVSIWTATIYLIDTLVSNNAGSETGLSALTPFDNTSSASYALARSSSPAVSVATPVKSSSSQLKLGESRKVVEGEIFKELQFSIFRGVGGFFEKFFDNSSWTSKQIDMYRAVLTKHKGSRWLGFPEVAKEAKVRDFFFSLHHDFLQGADNKIRATQKTHQVNLSNAQMDLFFLHQEAQERPHFKYEDMLVVAELKQTHDDSDFKKNFSQLGRYVRNVFAHQPLRLFVHAFLLCGSMMEPWVFDRSGAYSAGSFNIHTDKEKFARVLVGYSTMTGALVGLPDFLSSSTNTITLQDSNQPEQTMDFVLEENMFASKGIVCRGTACYRTKDGHVAKFAWAPIKRAVEAAFLTQARAAGVKGVVKILAQLQLTTIADLRSGLTFSRAHRFRDQGDTMNTLSEGLASLRASPDVSALPPQADDNADGDDDGPFENRVLTCHVVSPAGRVISDFRSVGELLAAIRDAIKGHRSLLLDADILHRDVSENNIIIVDAKDGEDFRGMLIDLDVAKRAGSTRSGTRHLTGTLPFMSMNVLKGYDHTCRDDVESFFYVLIWMCALKAWTKGMDGKAKAPRVSRLRKWEAGLVGDIIDAKMLHTAAPGLELILQEFPPSMEPAKDLCRRVRSILFGDSAFPFYGDFDDSQHLYELIVDAFDQTIKTLP